MKKKVKKLIMIIGIVLASVLVIEFFITTWTPKIKGDNSISELHKVEINGADNEMMIRGNNKDNPVVIFVHGGPCCSGILYDKKVSRHT